jgi:hypothetical protein
VVYVTERIGLLLIFAGDRACAAAPKPPSAPPGLQPATQGA